MATHLLRRAPHREAHREVHRVMLAPEVAPDLALPMGRVHEACGPSCYTFALWVAHRLQGPILWIVQPHRRKSLVAHTLAAFAHPGRFLFASPDKPEDILWCMEEALRSGGMPLTVADLQTLPDLTPVRRLQLAAEAGSAATSQRPTGILLTPGMGGAQGVETRWHMAPALGQGWQLGRLRARMAPPAYWRVEGIPETPRLSRAQPPAPPVPPTAPASAPPQSRHQPTQKGEKRRDKVE